MASPQLGLFTAAPRVVDAPPAAESRDADDRCAGCGFPFQAAELDAKLAAQPSWMDAPPEPAIHRRAVLPSVRADQEARARLASLFDELRRLVDRAGLEPDEREVVAALEHESLGDAAGDGPPWLAVLVLACREEVRVSADKLDVEQVLKSALARGRAGDVGFLARARCFAELRSLHAEGKAPSATIAQIARIWGVTPATVTYGVEAHGRRRMLEGRR